MPLSVLAIACLLAVTLGYVAVCAASPLATCRKCDGLGYQVKFNRRGKPKRARDCRRCDGYGKRIRIGRRLHNRARAIHRAGTR
ncbi:hypothetical protein OG512_30465 [Streptomyces sp. NBC_01378]|uniref:hypothetical protein n=1 Tax=Streptomyces sp. NBC_01378 TaxID=2903844 RepID=UPI00325410C9